MVSPPLSVEQIREHFDLFEPALAALHERHGGESPSEIYRLLTERIATLHLIRDEAFFIAQWEPGECFILVGATFSGRVTDIPFSDMISATKQYAESLGCERLTFASVRPAWRKIYRKLGFHLTPEGHYERDKSGKQEEAKNAGV